MKRTKRRRDLDRARQFRALALDRVGHPEGTLAQTRFDALLEKYGFTEDELQEVVIYRDRQQRSGPGAWHLWVLAAVAQFNGCEATHGQADGEDLRDSPDPRKASLGLVGESTVYGDKEACALVWKQYEFAAEELVRAFGVWADNCEVIEGVVADVSKRSYSKSIWGQVFPGAGPKSGGDATLTPEESKRVLSAARSIADLTGSRELMGNFERIWKPEEAWGPTSKTDFWEGAVPLGIYMAAGSWAHDWLMTAAVALVDLLQEKKADTGPTQQKRQEELSDTAIVDQKKLDERLSEKASEEAREKPPLEPFYDWVPLAQQLVRSRRADDFQQDGSQ